MSFGIKKICYFGIYRPTAPRDKVYLEGLKKFGLEVLECVDSSPGFLKFFRLAKKLHVLKNQYDIVWVGYLSARVVPIAWLFSRKKIVWNVLNSQYERQVLDRAEYSRFSPAAWFIWLLDFLSFWMADISLVETESQKEFLKRTFLVRPRKMPVVFTSADPAVFFLDTTVKKRDRFTAVFRGMFLPEVGIEHILEAAWLLRDEPIDFILVGWGMLLQKVKSILAEYRLSNLTLIEEFLAPDVLRELMLSCHVMLGQFGSHQHIDHTIQNKTSEALALGMPYITRDSASNRELLTDGKNCIFVSPAEPQGAAIVRAILALKERPDFRQCLSQGATAVYRQKLAPEVLGRQVLSILENFNKV